MSAAQVACALKRAGFEHKTVEECIAKLRLEGYLDDRRFAEAWVASRTGARALGRNGLKKGLMRRGVDPRVAEECLQEMGLPDDTDLAREMAARWLELCIRASGPQVIRDPATARRLSQYLLRRGFSYEVSARALAEVLGREWEAGGPDADLVT